MTTPVTKSMNVEAEFVKPRDYLVALDVTAEWVNNTDEFYTVIGTEHGSIRIAKVQVCTVQRVVQ